MAGLFTLSKNERLTSRKLIDKIFNREGEMISKFPLSFIFMNHELKADVPAQVMFSVPSRKVKKASGRNQIKRLLKESYRLHKPEFYAAISHSKNRQYACCLMYNSDLPADFNSIDEKVKSLLDEFGSRIS